MAVPMGKIGYNQTAITSAQAWGLSPASKAMKETPAMTSQNNNEATANTCETISQINNPIRDFEVCVIADISLLLPLIVRDKAAPSATVAAPTRSAL